MDRWMNGWMYKWISEQYIFIAPYSLKEDIGLVAIKALLQSIYHFITIIMIIISFNTVFAGVLFVHQPGTNHAPRASVTQVNYSVHTLSTFLRIRADPSMQIIIIIIIIITIIIIFNIYFITALNNVN